MTTHTPTHELFTPTKAEMQSYIDAPLANPGAIYLPAGKRKAARAKKPIYEGEFCPKETGKEARERIGRDRDKKLGSLLTYYSTTTIPFERVAEHLKLDIETVTRAMKQRGRLA